MSLCKMYLDKTYTISLEDINAVNIGAEDLVKDLFIKLHEWYVKIKNWVLKMVDKIIYNLGLLKDKIMRRFVKPIGEIHKKLVSADSVRAANITDKLKKRNINVISINNKAISEYENFLVKAVENIDAYAGKVATDGILKTLYFPKKNLTESYMEETIEDLKRKFANLNILGNMSVKEYAEKGHIELKEKTVSGYLGMKEYDFKTYDVISTNAFLLEFKLSTFEECLNFTANFGKTDILGNNSNLERIRNSINKAFEGVKANAGFDSVPEEVANSDVLVQFKFATNAAINLTKYIAAFKYDLLHVIDDIYNTIGMKSISTIMALSSLV